MVSVQASPMEIESSQSSNFSFYSKLQKEYCFSLHSFSSDPLPWQKVMNNSSSPASGFTAARKSR